MQTVPPARAGPVRVTLPVEELPPATSDGVKVMLEGTGRFDAQHRGLGRTGEDPLMVTVVEAVTVVVAIVKVADLAPAGIVTEPGTDAREGLLLLRVTTAPPSAQYR